MDERALLPADEYCRDTPFTDCKTISKVQWTHVQGETMKKKSYVNYRSKRVFEMRSLVVACCLVIRPTEMFTYFEGYDF